MIQNISIKIAHQMETKKLSQKPLRVQIIQKIMKSGYIGQYLSHSAHGMTGITEI